MKTFISLIIITFNFHLAYSQQKDSTMMKENQPFLGLRTTIYKVDNIVKAKAWYSEAFGVEPYFDEPYYVGFNIGGYELGLMPEEKSENEKTKSVIAYWGVNDIEKVYKRLISLGASEYEKPFNVGGELMTATVIGPWGNVIGLIYNPEFKLPGND